jgi:hypothetical protein
VAQALHCCSPTLKVFKLQQSAAPGVAPGEDDEDSGPPEPVRVQWADVLAAVSACRELEVLVLPQIEVEPLFPRSTAFARLT